MRRPTAPRLARILSTFLPPEKGAVANQETAASVPDKLNGVPFADYGWSLRDIVMVVPKNKSERLCLPVPW